MAKINYKNTTIYVNGKQKLLHRYIMECKIGRELLQSEQVHHIDGDHYNNNIDNLQIVSAREHTIIHAKKRFGSFLDVSKKELQKLFIKEKKTMKEISEIFSVSQTTVFRRLKEFEISKPIIYCSCGSPAHYKKSKQCYKCYQDNYRKEHREELNKYFRNRWREKK
jgi:hypothetical protein